MDQEILKRTGSWETENGIRKLVKKPVRLVHVWASARLSVWTAFYSEQGSRIALKPGFLIPMSQSGSLN